jgi:hypothetical protein
MYILKYTKMDVQLTPQVMWLVRNPDPVLFRSPLAPSHYGPAHFI